MNRSTPYRIRQQKSLICAKGLSMPRAFKPYKHTLKEGTESGNISLDLR